MEKIAEKVNPTEQEKSDFIVQYNHNQGCEIRYSEREIEETIIDPETGEEADFRQRVEDIDEVDAYPFNAENQATTVTITVHVIEAWDYTEEEKQARERARKDAMTLTPADVWRALYKAKGLTKEALITLIDTTMTGIDIEAIKIEFGASLFYRGAKFGNNKMFDVIGGMLGYTEADMDYLFENKELPTT